jgi:RsiW-degrading membrane proteinase PrsW (M82 family)
VDGATLGILAGMSFLPPLLFAVWVRNHERHQREPILAVLGLFAYGGTLGVAIALMIEQLGAAPLGAGAGSGAAFLMLVVGAPLAEELAKGLGLGLVRRRILELEDGIIYGAAIGLGFGATESLLYGLQSLSDQGLADAVVTIAFRVLSSVLLHAGTTALLGYGYGRMRLRREGLAFLVPFYLLAVAQHALYNFLVNPQVLAGFAAAVVMVVVVTTVLRHQIRVLDERVPEPVAASQK